MRAAGLNHHDVWSLKGVGLPADRLPMILGCDGAGVDADGNEVIVHAVVPSEGWTGDETLDPRRTLLSELHDGTLAEQVAVPARQPRAEAGGYVVGDAACLSTAWLTAYRMLFTNSGLSPAGRSWSRAPAAASPRRWSSSARRPATGCGSPRATRPRVRGRWRSARTARSSPARGCPKGRRGDGDRRRGDVDALDQLAAPGGTVVICGATSGDAPPKAELTKIYFRQLRVVGSTMGTRSELERLARFVADRGIEPVVDSVHPLADARDGFARIVDGEVFGKVVITV